MDDQVQRRLAQFDAAFDALLAHPEELGPVAAVVDQASAGDLLGAVRDRSARHLERAPFDAAPRLAAALAAAALGEAASAERHFRALMEGLGRAGRTVQLVEVIEAAPPSALRPLLGEVDRLLGELPELARRQFAYRMALRCGDRSAAASILTELVRQSAAPLARGGTSDGR